MSHGNRYTATIDDDRDRLQELKGTLAHWRTMSRKFAEETRDPYALVQYMNLEHILDGALDAVERTLGLVMEEQHAGLVGDMSRPHLDICRKTSVFDSPC